MVKKLREKTGLSQKEFALKFNIPVRTLQQWEQNINSPSPYLLFMLEKQVNNSFLPRYELENKNHYKVCINDPFVNCEKVYPIQQRKVKEILEEIKKNKNVKKVILFGSSITNRCHIGSDIDIYIETSINRKQIRKVYDFNIDYFDNYNVDERLLNEIKNKGVIVYER